MALGQITSIGVYRDGNGADGPERRVRNRKFILYVVYIVYAPSHVLYVCIASWCTQLAVVLGRVRSLHHTVVDASFVVLFG